MLHQENSQYPAFVTTGFRNDIYIPENDWWLYSEEARMKATEGMHQMFLDGELDRPQVCQCDECKDALSSRSGMRVLAFGLRKTHRPHHVRSSKYRSGDSRDYLGDVFEDYLSLEEQKMWMEGFAYFNNESGFQLTRAFWTHERLGLQIEFTALNGVIIRHWDPREGWVSQPQFARERFNLYYWLDILKEAVARNKNEKPFHSVSYR